MNSFDLIFLLKSIPQMIIEGVPVALVIVVASTILGFGLGMLFAFINIVRPNTGRVYDSRFRQLVHSAGIVALNILKKFVRLFTGAVRGIPPVLLLFIVYFGLPQALKGVGVVVDTTDMAMKFLLVIIASAITVAGNASEMFRSAYHSIEVSQIEAGRSFGYNLFQRFWHIIMPQGLVAILPNIGNMLIQELQGSSLIYYVGVVDIMGKAKQINANVFNAKSIELYIAAAIIYWVLCFLISRGIRVFEKKIRKGTQVVRNEVNS